MKFFTQQWYRDTQKESIHFDLEATDEANQYSEEYFQRLYKDRMSEYMNEYLMWANEEELNLISAEKAAENRYLSRLHELSKKLPDEIKDIIADIRVAALGFVTQNVLDKIKLFCYGIRERTQMESETYWDYYNENIKDIIPEQIEKFIYSQHDAYVKKIGFINENYIIETEQCRKEYTFTFKNASVQQNIVKMGSLDWLYTEVYSWNGEYEVHILFHNSCQLKEGQDFILSDVVICAKDIIIEEVEPEVDETEVISNKVEEQYTEFL